MIAPLSNSTHSLGFVLCSVALSPDTGERRSERLLPKTRLHQGILESRAAPAIGLSDGDQGLDGIRFWRRERLAWDLWSAMEMQQGDVVAQEADVLYKAFEPAALKTRLKELLMRGCNGLASLEGDSIPDDIIRIFCEGGSVGWPITLVPPSLQLLKEGVQSVLISASVVGGVHRVLCSLSVSVC